MIWACSPSQYYYTQIIQDQIMHKYKWTTVNKCLKFAEILEVNAIVFTNSLKWTMSKAAASYMCPFVLCMERW